MKKIQFKQSGTKQIWNSAYINEICELLDTKYKAFLKDESFVVQAEYTTSQVQVRLTLAKKDGSESYPLEGVLPSRIKKVDEAEAKVMLLLDWFTAYFDEYFSSARETFLPIEWQEYVMEDNTLFARGFVRNMEAERLAEELLKQNGHGGYTISPISSDL